MGTKVTIAQLQADAEELFGDYEVEFGAGKVLVLRPLLRLTEKEQADATKLEGKFTRLLNGDVETTDALRDGRTAAQQLLRLLAKTKTQADAFIRAHGHDIVLIVTLFKGYREATQPGEAKDSSS